MDNALKLAKIAALVAVTVLAVCAADTLRRVRMAADALHTTLSTATITLNDTDRVVVGADAKLNAKGGIFDIVKATALHADRAVGEAAIASRQQRVAAAQMDGEIIATAGEVRTFVRHATVGMDGTFEDVHTALEPVAPLLRTTDSTIQSVNTLASNPDWGRALSAFTSAMHHGDSTMANVDKMSVDLQSSLHHSLHPSRKSLVFGGAWTVVKIAATHIP